MSSPETTAIIEYLLEKHQPADVPGYARCEHDIIVSYARVKEIYRESGLRLGRKHRSPATRQPIPVPGDFADYAPREIAKQLCARYDCGPGTIARWRRETGIKPPVQSPFASRKVRPVPDNFPHIARKMTLAQLREQYAVSHDVLRRWLTESGMTTSDVKPSLRTNFKILPIDRPTRDMSLAGAAADFMRHYGPVIRCNAAGEYHSGGQFYRRRTSTVLTGDEMIALAKRFGFLPDAWRDLSQPLQQSGARA